MSFLCETVYLKGMVARIDLAAPLVLAFLILARRGYTQTTLPTFSQISTEDYGELYIMLCFTERWRYSLERLSIETLCQQDRSVGMCQVHGVPYKNEF